MMKSRTKNGLLKAAYLGATGIVLTESVVGSYWDVARVPYVKDVFDELGYPMYFASIMGVAKAAAVAAIVAPGFARSEEWAYAGLTFVYGGAALSHLSIGHKKDRWVGPLVFAGLSAASYALRPAIGYRGTPLSALRRA
ncbi:DoxX family protein [Nocardia sp. NPDC052566]|uniref:DoxX family protein n=1 Tax=Nocardia sp. NPDC052566 TaxID=3364330 RepID=UPI0037C86D88